MRPQNVILSALVRQIANTPVKENEGVGYPIFPYWAIFSSSQ